MAPTNHTPPVSIQFYNLHGIFRTELHSIAINAFRVPENLTYLFDRYYLLYWEGKYLKSQICEGVIRREGIDYIVVFQNCTYKAACDAEQVLLSFRDPNKDAELPAYVLVRIQK